MVDQRESIANFRCAFRAHDPRDLDPVVEEDQRWPEFDPERAAKRAAAAVLDLQMPDAGVVLESLRDQRLGSAAIAAPGGAELDHRRPTERVDLSARWRSECEFSGHRHQYFLLETKHVTSKYGQTLDVYNIAKLVDAARPARPFPQGRCPQRALPFALKLDASLELPEAGQPDQGARSQQPQRMQLRPERQERNDRRDGRKYPAGIRRFGNQRRARRNEAGCHGYEAELNVASPRMVLEAFPGVHGRDRHD